MFIPGLAPSLQGCCLLSGPLRTQGLSSGAGTCSLRSVTHSGTTAPHGSPYTLSPSLEVIPLLNLPEVTQSTLLLSFQDPDSPPDITCLLFGSCLSTIWTIRTLHFAFYPNIWLSACTESLHNVCQMSERGREGPTQCENRIWRLERGQDFRR